MLPQCLTLHWDSVSRGVVSMPNAGLWSLPLLIRLRGGLQKSLCVAARWCLAWRSELSDIWNEEWEASMFCLSSEAFPPDGDCLSADIYIHTEFQSKQRDHPHRRIRAIWTNVVFCYPRKTERTWLHNTAGSTTDLQQTTKGKLIKRREKTSKFTVILSTFYLTKERTDGNRLRLLLGPLKSFEWEQLGTTFGHRRTWMVIKSLALPPPCSRARRWPMERYQQRHFKHIWT